MPTLASPRPSKQTKSSASSISGTSRRASLPAELVFDSQLTTYANLNWLNQRGILLSDTAARVGRGKMLGTDREPPRPRPGDASPLPALTRIVSHPAVSWMNSLRASRRPCEGPLRQITIIDLGHEEPTILLTNNFRSGCPTLVTR